MIGNGLESRIRAGTVYLEEGRIALA